jgi:hypothetical protein
MDGLKAFWPTGRAKARHGTGRPVFYGVPEPTMKVRGELVAPRCHLVTSMLVLRWRKQHQFDARSAIDISIISRWDCEEITETNARLDAGFDHTNDQFAAGSVAPSLAGESRLLHLDAQMERVDTRAHTSGLLV